MDAPTLPHCTGFFASVLLGMGMCDGHANQIGPFFSSPERRRVALTLAARLGCEVRVVLDAEPDNVAAMYVTMPDRQGMEVGFEALTDLQLLRG